MAIYVNKQKAKEYLSTPDKDKWFYLKDGKALKNIYDLRDFFDNCTEEEYSKYVSKETNDFIAWVKGVFKNERLISGLESARTAKEARLYTDRNIKMLERNANRS